MSGSREDHCRDSNLLEVRELPDSWRIAPLKRFGRFEAGAGFPHDEQGVEGEALPFFKVNSLGKADGYGRLVPPEDTVSVVTATKLRAYVFPPDTIVFAKIGAALLLGRLRTLPTAACLDNNLMGFMVEPPNSVRFFLYAMEMVKFDLISNPGTVPSLNQGQIANVKLVVPSPNEQAAIAAFLDRETAKIDALVEEQKRLIDLLKEKRQAVISHAVTKGLNPDAPMKDTGVEWLGQVPEHWEIGPLKRWAVVQTGVAKGKDLSDVETISVPYLRVANVQDGYIDLTEVANIDIAENALERYRLQAGDVLMNEGGDFDKLGRGHIWSGEIDPCVHQNHVFAVRPHSVTPEWLSWFSSSSAAQYYFMLRAKQSTNLASISSSNLMELPVPKPPDGEQAKIVSWIGLRVGELNKLRMLAQRSIELLNERREGLISAAVTGRIDVRGRSEEHEVAA